MEGKYIQDAIKEYSRHRPQRLTYQGSAPDGQTVALATLIPGWLPATHSLYNVYSPDRRTKVDSNDVDTYIDGSGAATLWLASSSGELWLEYTEPHVLTPEVSSPTPVAGVDTVAAQAPDDIPLIQHLATYYIMQRAADFYVAQYSKSLGAGDYPNYLVLGKEHLRLWEVGMGLAKPEGAKGGDAAGVQPYSGRVDWDSSTTGGSDRFAHRRRWT
ncbi:MAG: hypothetical protein ACH37Z_11445 [Anaerolineae bacterium]